MAQSADQRAQILLRVELGAEYGAVTYDWIISKGWNGYTHFYLIETANFETCSTRAEGDVIPELAKCDLEKGAKLEQIVYHCCRLAPIKNIIEKLIAILFSMTSNGETINEMMTKIFEYQGQNGWNCLIVCYGMLANYRNKGNDPNRTPMKKSIEDTIEFLIEMGRDNGVDMVAVINCVTKTGQTLFWTSSAFSEKVALFLITLNVKVNEIDHLFITVQFQFRSIRHYLGENGANPHVRTSYNTTQYNLRHLQSDASFNTMPKSIYFTIDGYTCRCSQSPCQNRLLDPWRYLNGVLNGQFTRVVGQGGEGRVLEGMWCGVKAAYKFVPIENLKIQAKTSYKDEMGELRRRLNESIQYNGTQSDLVVPFYAHYRFENYFK